IHVALKLAVFHHHDGAVVAADQSGDVRAVGHRGAQHHAVSAGIVGGEHESVGHFALVLEYVDPASTNHAPGKLAAAPHQVHGGHHVIEQVRGDAAGIIPVLTEAE